MFSEISVSDPSLSTEYKFNKGNISEIHATTLAKMKADLFSVFMDVCVFCRV